MKPQKFSNSKNVQTLNLTNANAWNVFNETPSVDSVRHLNWIENAMLRWINFNLRLDDK